MAIIERDKPLPRHTRLDYDECYAKLVLEKFFPNEYKNLELSDRPDLRDNAQNVGIEVTSAYPPHMQEALFIGADIPYRSEEEKKKGLNQLGKLGYEYTQYGMFSPSFSYTWAGNTYPDIEKALCAPIIEVVKKKLDKLNAGGYAELQQYNLFIQTEPSIDEWMPPKIMERLLTLSNREKRYTVIYVLAMKDLLIFDIESQAWTRLKTGTKLYGLSEQARAMVEEGEKQ